MVQIHEDLIAIYDKQSDKKNVNRLNEEINKIIESTDKQVEAV